MILQENKGISLIELAGLLTITGIAAAGYVLVSMTPTISHAEKNKITLQHMAEISQAIQLFHKNNQTLPCPAGPKISGATNEDLSLDKKTCPRSIGSVPTNILQLPEKCMLDGWGRKIRYHISEMEMNLTVTDLKSTTTKTKQGVFVLVSFGTNGSGAYLPSGEQIMPLGINSDNDNHYVQDKQSDDFDNVVTYMTADQLKYLQATQKLVSLEECKENSLMLARMTSGTVQTDKAYFVPALEMIWAMQDACFQSYPAITRTCPNNITYDPTSDNPCVCDNGKWNGNCKNE